MNGNEYQRRAMRTKDQLATRKLVDSKEYVDIGALIDGCMGLAGETGEFCDLMKKWIFHGKQLDEKHAQKELGDVMWYAALICTAFDWSMDDILEGNIRKLEQRYPEGFDTHKANNRAPEDV